MQKVEETKFKQTKNPFKLGVYIINQRSNTSGLFTELGKLLNVHLGRNCDLQVRRSGGKLWLTRFFWVSKIQKESEQNRNPKNEGHF